MTDPPLPRRRLQVENPKPPPFMDKEELKALGCVTSVYGLFGCLLPGAAVIAFLWIVIAIVHHYWH